MRILVKLPTRRPKQAINVIKQMQSLAQYPDNITYLISIDEDHAESQQFQKDLLKSATNVILSNGRSKNKIHAINRDIHPPYFWDILVNGADDFIPIIKGWDERISKDMIDNYPDLDGCLFYFDGTQKHFCTLPIMGRCAYDSLGYIYHPSYQSLWSDQEFTDYWRGKNKLAEYGDILFEHTHPATFPSKTGTPKANFDPLYKRNEQKHLWNEDEANYKERKRLGFPK